MDKTAGSILRFMLKGVLMTLPVLVPFLVYYIIADPFMVLRTPKDYFSSSPETTPQVGVNKGVVTINAYEHQRKQGREYNAFIFGSSISCHYDAEEWADLIGDQKIEPFHFDSSNESVEQMKEKVEYLDKKGADIDYALIVLDPIILTRENNDAPTSIDSPNLHEGLFHFLKFHYTFFRASTNSDFLKSWIPGKIMGKPVLYGNNEVFEKQPIIYNEVRNEEKLPLWDSLIRLNPEKFYSEHKLMPSPKTPLTPEPAITPQKKKSFEEIAEIFKRQNTDVRILIGPNRAKVVLNPSDLITLQEIFGKERVYDFSRSHVNDLENDTLLYDNTHYRPVYSSELMRLIYGKE